MTDILLEKDTILSNLKFIGKLTSTSKITLSPDMALISDSFLNSMFRTFFSTDDRNSSLSFCRLNISKSFEILKLLKRSKLKSDIRSCLVIVQDLNKATEGLENLKILYKNDIKLSCHIDLLIQSIQERLLDIDDDSFTMNNISESSWSQIAQKMETEKQKPEETKIEPTRIASAPIDIPVVVKPVNNRYG